MKLGAHLDAGVEELDRGDARTFDSLRAYQVGSIKVFK